MNNTNLGIYDKVTDIYNRRAFFEMTRKMLEENPNERFVLVTWNIQRFKVFNDLYGLSAGDAVLRRMGEFIKKNASKLSTYGRLEADNFVICFRMAEMRLEIYQRDLERYINETHYEYEIDVYCGIYEIDDISIQIEQMCDRSYIALQTLKGNLVKKQAFYDENLRQNLIREQQMVAEIDSAMESKQFVVYYQPIYSAFTSEPVSAEALIRWKHPEKGFIMPGEFIPLFEKNGLITKLDYYVWEEVCSFIRRELDLGHRVLPISVNVSRMNLLVSDLPEKVMSLIRKYRLTTQHISLEITESAYTNNGVSLLEITGRFQKYGFKIYMDDFGSGYSSLNMLKDTPVDTLKIDRGMINEIDESERAGSILNCVIRMSKWLEMDVVAEGVEKKKQVDYLRSVGCNKIQGFYFSKPLPEEEYVKLINKNVNTTPDMNNSCDDEDYDIAFDITECGRLIATDFFGPAMIVEITQDNLEIIAVNNDYYSLTGSTSATVLRDTKNGMAWIYPEDRQKILDLCKKIQKNGEIGKLLVRHYRQDGTLLYLECNYKYMGHKGECKVFCVRMNNVTSYMAEGLSLLKENTDDPQQTVQESASEEKTKKTVLIIDDNQINRKILNKIVGDDFIVKEAEDGRAALLLLQNGKVIPDLILLDIIMPVMNGFDFLEQKNKEAKLRNIPVIVLTQADDQDAELKALELGATDFIKKPYDPPIISQKIKNVIMLMNNE